MMVSNMLKVVKKFWVNCIVISCDCCKVWKIKVSCVGFCFEKYLLIGGLSVINLVSGFIVVRCSRFIVDD